jgi:cation diffusion facilitator family transporter
LLGGHSHDAADQIDGVLEVDAAGRRALWLSLAGLMVTAAIQAVVVVVSGSVALLGDTLHNVADALTAVPLLIAFRLARRPASTRYTYGYGRAEDLAGLFVIAMISLSAMLAAWEAIDRLIHPRDVHHLWAVAGAALVTSPATNWSPATASASGGASARRPSSLMAYTPAPTGSPAWLCFSAPAVSRSAGGRPTPSWAW